jgi:putative membrane protein
VESFVGWLGSAYLWVKAFHVIFVIFWMAGLFMLPRFLVYWSEVAPGSPENALWAERCQRLRRIILNPGMIIVWVLGLLLAFHLGWPLWLWVKFGIVAGLTLYHYWMLRLMRAFAIGQRPISEKALRLANEIPSLTTIAIVILVIVKPF